MREDHAYYDNGIVSQRRIYGEDGSIETRQIFNKKGKRDIYKEGSIFVSDVQIKIVRLNLHSNPTQDSVPLIYDRHELATQEFPFAFTGKVFEFYDGKRTHQKREESINNGVYHGPSTWWHKNGQRQYEYEWAQGKRLRAAAWDDKGAKVALPKPKRRVPLRQPGRRPPVKGGSGSSTNRSSSKAKQPPSKTKTNPDK